jgi:hypothetical protein
MTTEQQDKMYNRIRGLLRKAEGTNNEHEAEAFFAKAQELIMRYAIDEERMWSDDPEKRSKIETLNIKIVDRSAGADYKRKILNACARSNRCQMWYSPGMDQSTLAGYSSDILFVEMLYKSIVTQMNFKMAFAQAVSKGVHHKTFKNSFIAGFSSRISMRFGEMNRKKMDDLASEGTGMELILADRAAKVAQWVDENIRLGRARSTGSRNIDAGAYSSGTNAANQTDISGGRGRVTRSEQKGLGR